MIRFLAGKVRFKELSAVCVDVNGVGYYVNMPIGDLSRLGDVDAMVEVFVHTRVREDAIELFGFSDVERLSLFELLLAVNGVGPRMGLALLSGLESQELCSAVQSGDEARLVRVPGVGKKTAARIVLELRDRIQKYSGIAQTSSTMPLDVVGDVRSALSNLGYKTPQIEKAVRALEKKGVLDKDADMQSLLVEALKLV